MIDLMNASKKKITDFIAQQFDQDGEELFQYSSQIRQKQFGNKVYVRGLIEISNYCKQNCRYCGIRRDNQQAERYRLDQSTILACCDLGYQFGFRTFVMQGGEDDYYSDLMLCDLISTIKQSYPDAAITLSLGERSQESYLRLRQAGADRYLLRHETANQEHYYQLHPSEMSFENRRRSLYALKKIGFQTGAGFMVGSPGQTVETLAEDIIFLRELQPQMVGIGPFIPHQHTPLKDHSPGTLHQTLVMLAITRILLPKTLLPATTALGSIMEAGREMGLKIGANVVMPNLSPVDNRKAYSLYNGKLSFGAESAEKLVVLKNRIEQAGFQLDLSVGHYEQKNK